MISKNWEGAKMLGFHADTLSSSYYIAEYFSNNNKSMFRIQMTSYEKKKKQFKILRKILNENSVRST